MGLSGGGTEFATDVEVGEHACFGGGSVREQDSHPAREVPDLRSVALSFFAELLKNVVDGVGCLLEGRDGLLSGAVEAELVLGVGSDILECGANVTPLELHVGFETVSGGIGD